MAPCDIFPVPQTSDESITAENRAVLWGPCSEDEFKQRERTDQRSFDLAPPNRQLAKHIRDHRLSERRRNAFSARQIYAE